MEEKGTDASGWRLRGAPARFGAIVAAFAVGAGLAACGGTERQDADEPEGDFPVEITEAAFPNKQRLAETSNLELEIENVGDEQVPDLAVTICVDTCDADGSFSIRSEQPGLANPSRPVWILENDYPKLLTPGLDAKDLDEAPTAGAEAAQTNTFSFGPVAPGDSVDIVWQVTPVKGGTYTIHYEIAAGLAGNANAVTADGSKVEGEFAVTISTKPQQERVNDQGDVVPE